MRTWVFGYGSLVADGGGTALVSDAVSCSLLGYQRRWGVAMNNQVDLPAYKHYLDPAGNRPAVYVAYLDLARADGVAVNGAAIPVDVDDLPRLDSRERNYVRVDVTGQLDVDLGGNVYTYIGSEEGRGRLAAGLADGTAVIHAEYRDRVLSGFAALGQTDLFLASTAPEPCPAAELTPRENQR